MFLELTPQLIGVMYGVGGSAGAWMLLCGVRRFFGGRKSSIEENLQAQLAAEQATIAEIRGRELDLMGQLTALQDHNEDLKKQVSSFAQAKISLEDELEDWEANAADLHDEMIEQESAFKRQVEEIRQAVSERWEQRVREMRREVSERTEALVARMQSRQAAQAHRTGCACDLCVGDGDYCAGDGNEILGPYRRSKSDRLLTVGDGYSLLQGMPMVAVDANREEGRICLRPIYNGASGPLPAQWFKKEAVRDYVPSPVFSYPTKGGDSYCVVLNARKKLRPLVWVRDINSGKTFYINAEHLKRTDMAPRIDPDSRYGRWLAALV